MFDIYDAGISWLAATYSTTLGKKGATAGMLRNAVYILTAIVLLSHTFGLVNVYRVVHP